MKMIMKVLMKGIIVSFVFLQERQLGFLCLVATHVVVQAVVNKLNSWDNPVLFVVPISKLGSKYLHHKW